MAWTTHPGLPGKIYVPDDPGKTGRKYPCSGCFSCQWCDDNRCRVCRGEGMPADAPAAGQGCSCKQGTAPSNSKSQAPDIK